MAEGYKKERTNIDLWASTFNNTASGMTTSGSDKGKKSDSGKSKYAEEKNKAMAKGKDQGAPSKGKGGLDQKPPKGGKKKP